MSLLEFEASGVNSRVDTLNQSGDPGIGSSQNRHQPGAPWSVRDAAKFLGLSERHLIRLIDDGKVESFLLGRRRLISDSELRRIASGS